jgi:hypothetical protein
MTLPAELERMRRSDEPLEAVVEAGNATLAVTEQRLLALTPDSDGANFRAVERPNVEAVTSGATGNATHLHRAIRPGILGCVLLGASQFVNLDGVAGASTPEGTDQLGLGGLFALLELFLGFLALLDTLLLLGGLGLLCLALVLVAAYGHSRSRELRVSVAGDEDLRVPLDRSAVDAENDADDPATVLNHALTSADSTGGQEASPTGESRTDTPTETA